MERSILTRGDTQVATDLLRKVISPLDRLPSD
jgi:hypothetical protein